MNYFKSIVSALACILYLGFLSTSPALAQVYDIPFGSKGNTIELEVVNSGEQSGSDLKVVVTEIPDWIQINQTELSINSLSPQQTHTAVFTFDASEQAKVGQTAPLTFHILENGKAIGTREYSLRSEAPATFELFNNYPNPFNPATTISYQLPEAMEVKILIYNILGQQVATLINTNQEPGKYAFRWDASAQSSGMYLYRFQGTAQSGKTYIDEQKMLLIK
ncbi:T9SS type A sorting domain-containing protein [Gracilimonas sp.]|uniref:T9SS type A sorting domain-containing protein n=1 Tax=Gracilimonas sp. TaxID=1974203 RepID=UPI0032EECB55